MAKELFAEILEAKADQVKYLFNTKQRAFWSSYAREQREMALVKKRF